MKKLLFGALISAVLVHPAFTQDAPGSQRPTSEQIHQFLDLLQAKQMMVQMIDGMKAAQKKGAEETFKRLVPNPSPGQLERLNSITDDVFRDFPIDEMIDAVVPVYQRHLTKDDVAAIVAFYQSPAGEKLMKERPAMMAESMQAGQGVMLKRLPEILDRLQKQVTQLADAESKKNQNRSQIKD